MPRDSGGAKVPKDRGKKKKKISIGQKKKQGVKRIGDGVVDRNRRFFDDFPRRATRRQAARYAVTAARSGNLCSSRRRGTIRRNWAANRIGTVLELRSRTLNLPPFPPLSSSRVLSLFSPSPSPTPLLQLGRHGRVDSPSYRNDGFLDVERDRDVTGQAIGSNPKRG